MSQVLVWPTVSSHGLIEAAPVRSIYSLPNTPVLNQMSVKCKICFMLLVMKSLCFSFFKKKNSSARLLHWHQVWKVLKMVIMQELFSFTSLWSDTFTACDPFRSVKVVPHPPLFGLTLTNFLSYTPLMCVLNKQEIKTCADNSQTAALSSQQGICGGRGSRGGERRNSSDLLNMCWRLSWWSMSER